MLISSSQNDRVKLVRGLQSQAKQRRQARQFVLEGVRLVRDALDSGARPVFAFYTEEAAQVQPAKHLVKRLGDIPVPCLAVTDALMREMSDTETPQGVLAVFPWPDLPIPEQPHLVLIADGWRDPGNLGTVMRTAAAAGVDLLVLPPGTVDALNPKTVRASMGAIFRLPILTRSWAEIGAQFSDLAFYLADAAGDVPYDQVDWSRPSVIVIGGEANGFGEAAQSVPHTVISIPMMPGAESLNAGVAAALLIYEARRGKFR